MLLGTGQARFMSPSLINVALRHLSIIRRPRIRTRASSFTRACPQLEDSQVDYRVIHRRSADSGADGCAATPFGTINGTGSRMFCPAAKGMLASPPRTTGYSSRRCFTVFGQG